MEYYSIIKRDELWRHITMQLNESHEVKIKKTKTCWAKGARHDKILTAQLHFYEDQELAKLITMVKESKTEVA